MGAIITKNQQISLPNQSDLAKTGGTARCATLKNKFVAYNYFNHQNGDRSCSLFLR
jgi:hypothetical protein